MIKITDDGKYIVEGIVLTADGKPNPNGIKYDTKSVIKAVAEFNKRGEDAPHFGHLFDINNLRESGMRYGETDLSQVSHRVTSLNFKEDDGTVVCCMELMNTPMGKIVKDLIDAPVKLGISSRDFNFEPTPIMTGTVDVDRFATDIHIFRIDVAPEPSEPGEAEGD